jgi:uncharacterized protein (TIGR02391 family)
VKRSNGTIETYDIAAWVGHPSRDIPTVEVHAERHARHGQPAQLKVGFEDLLHPIVFEHAFQHYKNGHLREAVLNSIVAVFDLIRERAELAQDGQHLVSEAFSLERPHLIFSELQTESGRNDQKGFLQILSGAYAGIRNPKAHSLQHDLDEHKAAQYLVFVSLLARRRRSACALICGSSIWSTIPPMLNIPGE